MLVCCLIAGRKYRHNKGTPKVDENGRRLKDELKTKEQV
jgi:hypothetical protein